MVLSASPPAVLKRGEDLTKLPIDKGAKAVVGDGGSALPFYRNRLLQLPLGPHGSVHFMYATKLRVW